jgi:hypothetical protein
VPDVTQSFPGCSHDHRHESDHRPTHHPCLAPGCDMPAARAFITLAREHLGQRAAKT